MNILYVMLVISYMIIIIMLVGDIKEIKSKDESKRLPPGALIFMFILSPIIIYIAIPIMIISKKFDK